MKTKLIIAIVAILCILAVGILVFYPKGEIDVSTDNSAELNVYGEADINAEIIQVDFSDKYKPFMEVKVIDFSSDIVGAGDLLKIYLSGTEHMIKSECQKENTIIINSNCTETDPAKIFEGWNSYTLQNGNKVSIHVRKVSVKGSEAIFEAEDENIKQFILD